MAETREGTVCAVFGREAAVFTAKAQQRCPIRRNTGQVVCGDRVRLEQTAAGQWVIAAVLPRRNTLSRTLPHGARKILAANIDRILITVDGTALPAPQADPDSVAMACSQLLDSYLTAAALANIPATILINKMDLIPDGQDTTLATVLAGYTAAGYTIGYVSARTHRGTTDLVARLAGQRGIFVGQSGAGKSSLIQAVTAIPDIRIGTLGDQGHGRHTTTTTTLYQLPNGAEIIDSPGIREFGLWHVPVTDLRHGYPEFAPLAQRCRFHDCLHDQEPGCAVRDAVDNGRLNRQRWLSYRCLVEQLRAPRRR